MTYKFKVLKVNPEYPEVKGSEVELTLDWAKKVGLKGYAPSEDQEFLEMINDPSVSVDEKKEVEPVKVETEVKAEKKKK